MTTVPEPIIADSLEVPVASHGFFTRTGGISTGIYSGLNTGLGSGDDRTKVTENRRRVATFLGVPETGLLSPYQVHSPDVLVVRQPWQPDERPKVDALVTDQPGLAIGVLAADCGPVIFLDPEARIAGAAHAGWKGAVSGVLENTITAMEGLGAKRDHIRAVLGPTISAGNYEVGPEFVDRLLELDNANSKWLSPSKRDGHAMFDLPGYIVERLDRAGVAAQWTGQCTYAGETEFFSYRRTTHRGEEDYGRQISAIALKP